MRLMSCAIAVFALSLAGPSVAQDLTIVSNVTRDGGAPAASVSYISSDHVRMSQSDGREIIVDFKSAQITTLDGKKKTYYVTTRQDMDALAARMQEQMNSPEMKKAQESMKSLPAEDQHKMDAAMDGMFAFNAQKSGTTRTIVGYTCENWTVTMGQFSRTEECLTTGLKFPPQAWEMYQAFAENMKSMMAAMGPMAKSAARMQEQLRKMRGYPLASSTTVDIMGHKSATSREVTAVKQGPIPASAWEIPAGYTRIDNPMVRMLAKNK